MEKTKFYMAPAFRFVAVSYDQCFLVSTFGEPGCPGSELEDGGEYNL